MHFFDSRTASAMATPVEPRCGPNSPVNIIEDEPEWRAQPHSSLLASSRPRVVATRWHALDEGTREVSAETAGDCHLVKIVLRSMKFRLSVGGRTVQDGLAMPGMLHVTEPGLPARCLFNGPYDTLHLHVPNDLIAECTRDMPGHQAATLFSEPNLALDPTAERLGRVLLGAEQVGGSFGQLYAECIGIAIVARLLAAERRKAPSDRPKVAKLAKWRLKRAIDYVEARLAEHVSLADMASATGLTRVYFGAQFKAATGLRPHEYLLRPDRARSGIARRSRPVGDGGRIGGRLPDPVAFHQHLRELRRPPASCLAAVAGRNGIDSRAAAN
jgi:AraC family transcriptional regulator